MKEEIHVMLDLETLGNRINPVLVQISAVTFSFEEDVVPKEFDVLINDESCANIGLEYTASTLDWWKQQSHEAQAKVFNPEGRLHVEDALLQFYDFIKDKSDDFDPYKFKYLIDDIRNYIYKMDYYLINERVNEPEPIQLFGNSEHVNLNHFSHIKFDTDYTLRQRIDFLLTLDICILDKWEFYRLLEFTDIAEELYRINVTNKVNAPIINSNINPVQLATHNPAHLRFDSNLSENKLIAIKSYFIRKNMLADTTDENWLYWFKKSDCDNPTILNWTNSPTMLVNCFSLISNNYYRKAIRSAFGIPVPSPTLKNFERTGTHNDLTHILAE